jgi:pyruvate carboxylase subunit B
MAKSKGLEFYTGNPQDLYPDQLDEYRAEMKKKNWDTGQDDEELLELAMHPEQYRAYKSGDAKRDFDEDIAKRKAEQEASESDKTAAPVNTTNGFQPKTLVVNIDDEEYVVHINYPENGNGAATQTTSAANATVAAPVAAPAPAAPATGKVKEVSSPLEGKFFLTKDSSETAVKVGDKVKKNDIIGYIESMKTYNAISSEVDGTVTEICFANGDSVDEDDILIKLQ